jgi:hypothetical protein
VVIMILGKVVGGSHRLVIVSLAPFLTVKVRLSIGCQTNSPKSRLRGIRDSSISTVRIEHFLVQLGKQSRERHKPPFPTVINMR